MLSSIPPSSTLHDTQPTALRRAVLANLYAFFHGFKAAPSSEFIEMEGFACWKTSLPYPFFNGVLVTRLPRGDENQFIQDREAFFDSRGVSKYNWWLGADIPKEAWSEQLAQHGYNPSVGPLGMAIDLHTLPEPRPVEGLVISPVHSDESLRIWTTISMEGSGFPASQVAPAYELFNGYGLDGPAYFFTGFLDGVPVATSMLLLACGTAGIYCVATLEAYRKQGIGSALSLHALHHARTFDYHVGVLQATRMGRPVYEQIGFQSTGPVEPFSRE